MINKDDFTPIKGFDGYGVSKDGRFLNFKTGRCMNGYLDKEGYIRVTFHTNGTEKKFSKHTIIARTFIPNPKNKPCVNHIDGDKLNNSLSNLEWVTHKENAKHASDNGLNPTEHLVSETILTHTNGQKIRFDSIKAAAEFLNVHRCTIHSSSARSKKIRGTEYTAKVATPKNKGMKIKLTNGSDIKIFNSQTDAAKELQVHQSRISACLNGRQKTIKGYTIEKI